MTARRDSGGHRTATRTGPIVSEAYSEEGGAFIGGRPAHVSAQSDTANVSAQSGTANASAQSDSAGLSWAERLECGPRFSFCEAT